MSAGRVVMTFTADEAQFVNKTIRARDTLASLEEKAKKLKETNKKMASEFTLDKAIGSATKLALTYLSVETAIQAMTKAFAAYNAEREKASQTVRAGESAMTQLAQLSGGSSAEMARMTQASRATARETGLSLDEAARMQFTLESMGKGGQRSFYNQFVGIADAGKLAEGVSTLQAAMGTKETGGDAQMVAKLFAASKASKTALDQFAPAATTAAQAAKMVGTSDEELLAIIAEFSKSTRSPEVAGTQAGAFAAGLIKNKQFSGMGMVEAAKAIQARGFSDQKLLQMFGQEGLRGYQSMIGQEGAIRGTMADIQSAQANAPAYLSGIVGAARSDAELVASRNARIAERQAELGMAGVEGTSQLRRERAVALIESKLRGKHWTNRYVSMARVRTAAWLGYEAEDLAESARPLFAAPQVTLSEDEIAGTGGGAPDSFALIKAMTENTQAMREVQHPTRSSQLP